MERVLFFPTPPPISFFLFKALTGGVKRRKPLDAGIRLRFAGYEVRTLKVTPKNKNKKKSQIKPGNRINSAPYKTVSVLFPIQISTTKLVGRPVSQLLA